jgi:hypothetical protein
LTTFRPLGCFDGSSTGELLFCPAAPWLLETNWSGVRRESGKDVLVQSYLLTADGCAAENGGYCGLVGRSVSQVNHCWRSRPGKEKGVRWHRNGQTTSVASPKVCHRMPVYWRVYVTWLYWPRDALYVWVRRNVEKKISDYMCSPVLLGDHRRKIRASLSILSGNNLSEHREH